MINLAVLFLAFEPPVGTVPKEGALRFRTVSSVIIQAAVVVAMVAVAPASASAAPAAKGSDVSIQQTVVARYGPWTVAPDAMTGNQVFSVPRPCQGCYITGMQPDLVYADGTSANHDTRAMLHHAVLLNNSRSDATCSNAPGQRFFASGNERVNVNLPAGYGYRINSTDQLFGVVDLMNHNHTTSQTFYFQVTYTFTTSTLTPVRPVWLDIDQCGDSEYAIPAGVSDTHYDWTVNVPGRVVFAAGHLHDEGVRIEATQGSTSICNSVAGYGETPDYIDHHGGIHLSSMSTCSGNVATLTQGQVVRLHSIYDSPMSMTDVMGIMIMYVG